MKIKNIIPDFLRDYEGATAFDLADLETYIEEHADIFADYFPTHCPRTEERLQLALQQYPARIDDIRRISETLPDILLQLEGEYDRTFGINLGLSFRLIVGTFGSNAFVAKNKRRDIYFAAEKLSSERDHLRIIGAHEIGHSTHFELSTRAQLDWGSVNWMNGLTILYTEGIATYLSMKLVPGMRESAYFTYDAAGDPWTNFYRENEEEIKRRFLEDAETGWDMAKEKEWFRLSGGSYFGLNRLGYLLGTAYVQQLVERVGEEAALTYWAANDVNHDTLEWLRK